MENTSLKVDFQKWFVNLLAKLSEREQDVLKKRYQLTSDLSDAVTLQSIGNAYKITRERVRQIERDAINKMIKFAKDKEFAAELKQLEDALVHQLERHGGLADEAVLLENFVKQSHPLDTLHVNAYLFTLDHLFDTVERVDGHEYFCRVWKLKAIEMEHAADLIERLENHLVEKNKLHSEDEILRAAKELLPEALEKALEKMLAKHPDLNLEKLLHSYLTASSRVAKNILEQWGLSDWPNVCPKKLSDKIKLVFEKIKKPLHFNDIAAHIHASLFDKKMISPATIHNELIANGEFVLVGRGLYAMKDWGYQSGTVADVVTAILIEANGPLSKEEIYKKVIAQRQVNPSTIYLALLNKDKFVKMGEGKYGLKK